MPPVVHHEPETVRAENRSAVNNDARADQTALANRHQRVDHARRADRRVRDRCSIRADDGVVANRDAGLDHRVWLNRYALRRVSHRQRRPPSGAPSVQNGTGAGASLSTTCSKAFPGSATRICACGSVLGEIAAERRAPTRGFCEEQYVVLCPLASLGLRIARRGGFSCRFILPPPPQHRLSGVNDYTLLCPLVTPAAGPCSSSGAGLVPTCPARVLSPSAFLLCFSCWHAMGKRNSRSDRLNVWQKEYGMKFGVYMFPTDYAMHPAELARAVEAHGFESLFFPEHTHIPTSRRSPFSRRWGTPKSIRIPWIRLWRLARPRPSPNGSCWGLASAW